MSPCPYSTTTAPSDDLTEPGTWALRASRWT